MRGPHATLTVLRDPIDWMVSHYAFHKGLPEHQAAGSGFAVAIGEGLDLPSYCARFLGQESGIRRQFQWLGADVSEALRALDENISIFGLTERLDEFFALLKTHLRFRNIEPQRSNPSRAEVVLSNSERGKLAEFLKLDIEFHR